MATTRRGFLLAGLGAAVAPLLPKLAWARALEGAATGRALLVVELGGGNDGLNTVVPYDDPHYVRARPTLRIPAKEALRIGDGLGCAGSLAHQGASTAARSRSCRGRLPRPRPQPFRSTDIWHSASLEFRARAHRLDRARSASASRRESERRSGRASRR
jgi:uncharacterized protein (DUF1501 family)